MRPGAARCGTRTTSLLLRAALAAAFWALASASPVRGQEEAEGDPDFRRAMRLFQDPSEKKRAEGERLLKALGARALRGLEAWILRAEGQLLRAKDVLARLGGARTADPLAAARPYFSEALKGAWERFRAGAYPEAKRTAEAVLRLDPDSPELWQIRRLIRLCEERLLHQEVLEPSVEFREPVSGLEETPQVVFRLTNHSRSAVTVRAERGLLGSLSAVFDRRFFDGSRNREERTIPIRAAPDEERIRLQPGEKYEIELAVPLEEPRPPRGMAVRVRVVGKFQPSQWGLEDRNLSRTLHLPAAECWMVASQEKPLASSPLRKLESALFFRNIHSFFTAGQLAVWAAEDDPLLNEKLLKILVESLAELDPTGTRVADSLLEEASGVKRDRKLQTTLQITDHWQRWWEARRTRSREPQAPPALLPEKK